MIVTDNDEIIKSMTEFYTSGEHKKITAMLKYGQTDNFNDKRQTTRYNLSWECAVVIMIHKK